MNSISCLMQYHMISFSVCPEYTHGENTVCCKIGGNKIFLYSIAASLLFIHMVSSVVADPFAIFLRGDEYAGVLLPHHPFLLPAAAFVDDHYLQVRVCACVCVCAYMYIHVTMHVYKYLCTYINIYISMHTYTHVYDCINTCIYPYVA